MIIRPVAEDQWSIVAWLYQDFRHDLASVVNGFPYSDGRYRHEWLDEYPAADRFGYLVWAPHPNHSDELAPIAFALVKQVDESHRELAALFVVPAARYDGLGRRLALDVLGRHPGQWSIAFQHDNVAARGLWRKVAREAFDDGWTEEQRPVPGKPDVPPDHWISGFLTVADAPS